MTDPNRHSETGAGAPFDPVLVWRMVLDELALTLPAPTFDTWMRDTHVIAYEDGEFIIGIPNPYARDWLQNRLRNQIKRTLRSIMQRSVQVNFRVAPQGAGEQSELNDAPLLRTDNGQQNVGDGQEENDVSHFHSTEAPLAGHVVEPAGHLPAQVRAKELASVRYSTQLNAHHTFDSFVVGNHNRMAHAAARAVADQPGQQFNPLFVYGGVGLGKTHLLHAIGNQAQANGYQTLYCSSEQFTNELISAIRSQSTEAFRNKYRQVDILLIDDIQFIGGKESTQEEFFHTFNHLHASGRQVILSSDRPPKALATLEERLRSRFEGGLQTDISQPDFETRVAILQSKANKLGLVVEHEVLMLVAERVDSNIRELEGALNHLSLQAKLVNSRLSYSLAVGILDNLAPHRTPCTPSRVLQIVAEHYGLTVDILRGRKRTKTVAGARQVAMYLLREENNLSLPAIGEQLGGRDHSTVRYGVDKVAEDLDSDEELRQAILQLREKIYTPFVG